MTDTTLTTRTPAQQVMEAACVLDKHKKPSHADRAAFCALVEQEPGVWRMAGDLARGAQDKIVAAMGTTVATSESVKIGMREMRHELVADGDGRLIKLLVEQVLVCWLQMYHAQYQYTVVMAEDHTFAKGAYWQRRLTATQGRYLRALETLARVKRLAIPVQVNIAADGGQQVNVAQ